MAIVYILESLRDGRFYIGSTENLSQRLRHHRGGFTHSTKRFGEVKVVFTQSFPSLAEARKIEMRLKKLKRKDYLRKIIKDGEIKMRP
ncbi:MAG: GIY-YIG nuclease family protein [bacterium]|nr:GIY-YIG nuclease family protein [bacterium]